MVNEPWVDPTPKNASCLPKVFGIVAEGLETHRTLRTRHARRSQVLPGTPADPSKPNIPRGTTADVTTDIAPGRVVPTTCDRARDATTRPRMTTSYPRVIPTRTRAGRRVESARPLGAWRACGACSSFCTLALRTAFPRQITPPRVVGFSLFPIAHRASRPPRRRRCRRPTQHPPPLSCQ